MTKTLADMTEEERAECVGMWVSYQTPMGEHTAIYEAGTTLFLWIASPRYAINLAYGAQTGDRHTVNGNTTT